MEPAPAYDVAALFDPHAILFHPAEKHGRFLPRDGAARAATLSWLQLVATNRHRVMS